MTLPIDDQKIDKAIRGLQIVTTVLAFGVLGAMVMSIVLILRIPTRSGVDRWLENSLEELAELRRSAT